MPGLSVIYLHIMKERLDITDLFRKDGNKVIVMVSYPASY